MTHPSLDDLHARAIALLQQGKWQQAHDESLLVLRQTPNHCGVLLCRRRLGTGNAAMDAGADPPAPGHAARTHARRLCGAVREGAVDRQCARRGAACGQPDSLRRLLRSVDARYAGHRLYASERPRARGQCVSSRRSAGARQSGDCLQPCDVADVPGRHRRRADAVRGVPGAGSAALAGALQPVGAPPADGCQQSCRPASGACPAQCRRCHRDHVPADGARQGIRGPGGFSQGVRAFFPKQIGRPTHPSGSDRARRGPVRGDHPRLSGRGIGACRLSNRRTHLRDGDAAYRHHPG